MFCVLVLSRCWLDGKKDDGPVEILCPNGFVPEQEEEKDEERPANP